MYSRSMFRSAILVVMLVAFAALTFAARPSSLSDGLDRVQQTGKAFVRTPHGGLDQDYNEFRYVKTTDYGVTWTDMMVAGDMESFAPNEDAWPDFDAVVTATNELCYAVILHEAATPGAYALVGPSFTPVLVMAEGDNSFDTGYNTAGGRTGIGRCANGTLVMIIWGHSASGENTLWASKSADNGATWNTPWIAANEAMLGAEELYSHYFHLSQRLHDDYGFAVYQTIGDEINPYPQHFLRFPLAGGLGTVLDFAATCGHPYSYMYSASKPIAYDPAVNALFVTYRNFDLDGMWVYYSNNMGTSFSPANSISHPGQRYPSMALRNEGSVGTPFLIWNMTTTMPVGDPQCAWLSYDEFGYGGNAWTDPQAMTCVTRTDRGSIGECIYVNQGYFWDGTHGVGVHNGATDPLTGEIVSTTYTTDGGMT